LKEVSYLKDFIARFPGKGNGESSCFMRELLPVHKKLHGNLKKWKAIEVKDAYNTNSPLKCCINLSSEIVVAQFIARRDGDKSLDYEQHEWRISIKNWYKITCTVGGS